MSKILVTTYINPDLDGCSCMVSFADFLRKQGRDAVAGYFGEPQQDAKFAFERFGVDLPGKAEDLEYDEVVLVDVSNVQRLDPSVNPSKVVEIIDHHEPHPEDFPNAKTQVEHLGAAATLVAERIFLSDETVSEPIAKMLQLAIMHGTLNFKASVSTDKDKRMFERLSQIATVSQKEIDDFFELLTSFKPPLVNFLRDDFKNFEVSGVSFGIASLLIHGLDNFLVKYKQEVLEALETLKSEYSLEYIWFAGVDLMNGISYLLVPDSTTEELVHSGLKIDFKDHEARIGEMLLRKEQLKMMSEYLRTRK